MANGAAEPVFIDSNVLIHASAASSPFHKAAQESLRFQGQDHCEIQPERYYQALFQGTGRPI